MKTCLSIFMLASFVSACGVKGRPLPPNIPREIGIGKPQYKGVDQELIESRKSKKNKSKKNDN